MFSLPSSPVSHPLIPPSYSMQTRSKSGITKPDMQPTLLLSTADPTSVEQALDNKSSKIEKAE